MAKEKDIPVLKGFLTVDGRQIKVWCPFCKDYHTHGALEEERQGKRTHRVAHCHGDNHNKYFLNGYYVQLEKRKIFR